MESLSEEIRTVFILPKVFRYRFVWKCGFLPDADGSNLRECGFRAIFQNRFTHSHGSRECCTQRARGENWGVRELPVLSCLCKWMPAAYRASHREDEPSVSVVPCIWNGIASIYSRRSPSTSTSDSQSNSVMIPRIILTHIPRTGGTSLFAALRTQMPEAKAGEFESFSELALMKDRELNSYSLISTYVGSKLFERLDDSWTKITVLRDPEARLRSSYLNLRGNPENISFASALAKSRGFREYLASRDAAVTFQANNVQAWSVLGDKSIYYRHKHADFTNPELAAMAIERLKIYDLVGFTESLGDFWSHLCHRFGWSLSPLQQLRMNSLSCTLESPSKEDLEHHTRLDVKLVQSARSASREKACDLIEMAQAPPTWAS